jgi:hypothetical protein
MNDIHEFHDERKCCYGCQFVSGKILKNPFLTMFHIIQCVLCISFFALYFVESIKIKPIIYFIVDICLTSFYLIEIMLLIFYWRWVCSFVLLKFVVLEVFLSYP